MLIEILVGIIVVLIVFSGIVIVVAGDKIKRYKNEINDSNRAIDGWITSGEKYKDEIVELKKEIKNLNLENDAINEQRNVEKNTYQLEHNQIEEIRKILEG